MGNRHRVMGILKGWRKPHCIQTVDNKTEADNMVACMLMGDAGYVRAWVESESDERTDLENDVQRQIDRDTAP